MNAKQWSGVVIRTVAVAAALVVGGAAWATDLVLDASAQNGASARSAGFAPLTFVSGVEHDVEITGIEVLNDLVGDGDLRFVIIDEDTHDLAYLSDAQSYTDDGMSWKASDSFLFTLQQGHQYLIGAIANVAASWAYQYTAETEQVQQNGITVESGNTNVSGFPNPSVSGKGKALIPLRLHGSEGGGEVSPIPEPRGMAMMLAGLGALGWLSRRRRPAD